MVSIPASVDQSGREASPRMVALLRELADEREIKPEDRDRLVRKLDAHESADPDARTPFPFDEARTAIKWFFANTKVKSGRVPSHIAAMPKAERRPEARNLTPATRNMKRDPATLPTKGMFRLDGEIYVIVPTKTEGRHIAMRLVESPPRLNQQGDEVDFDYVRAPGVIWALYPEHELPVAEIEAMMIQRRVCIYPGCYRTLKAAKSVAAGVGKRHAEKLGIPWGGKR